jgi:hypothetical protein
MFFVMCSDKNLMEGMFLGSSREERETSPKANMFGFTPIAVGSSLGLTDDT